MAVRMTAAQARALGIGDGVKARKKTTAKAAPAAECAPNRCVTCDYVTAGETDEVRHMTETGHLRYETTAVAR